jgi:hypothetical protein
MDQQKPGTEHKEMDTKEALKEDKEMHNPQVEKSVPPTEEKTPAPPSPREGGAK